jgi:hypothetical protein
LTMPVSTSVTIDLHSEFKPPPPPPLPPLHLLFFP